MKRIIMLMIVSVLWLSALSPHFLYTGNASTTPAYLTGITQLTTSSSRDLNPTWSQDNSKIAYISDWNVWVMNTDGTGKVQLTSGSKDIGVTYSPDGTKMAFSRYVRSTDRADLMIMNSDGSNITQITNSGLHHGQPSWSHNAEKLAFYYGGAGTNTNEIHIMDIDGTNEVTVLSNSYAYMNPVWSPDDTKLVYSQSDGIWLLNTVPPYDKTHLFTTTIPAADPVFSPDGRYVLYSIGEISTPGNPIYRDICLITTEGSFIAQLTNDSVIDYPFSWSPNGQYIAFGSVKSGNDDIWRATIVLPGPRITLSPSTGFASTTIAGSGFSNNSAVAITWDGTTMQSVPNSVITDVNGSFAAVISVLTQTAPGAHTVNVTDESGNWATATFTVIDMKGQKGDTGELGPQGNQGIQGPKGDTGLTGAQGPSGNIQDLLIMVALPTIVSVLAICLSTVAILKKRS